MGPHRPPFGLFSLFSNDITYILKTVDFSGIRTGIFGVEGKQADHLTTTKAQEFEEVLDANGCDIEPKIKICIAAETIFQCRRNLLYVEQ